MRLNAFNIQATNFGYNARQASGHHRADRVTYDIGDKVELRASKVAATDPAQNIFQARALMMNTLPGSGIIGSRLNINA